MGKFGFGKTFLSWVRLLYISPQAAIRVVGQLSPTFSLCRGTQQRCPLSLLLFVIATEPLAAMICFNLSTLGFQYGERQEKIILYADNNRLLLGDANTSL